MGIFFCFQYGVLAIAWHKSYIGTLNIESDLFAYLNCCSQQYSADSWLAGRFGFSSLGLCLPLIFDSDGTRSGHRMNHITYNIESATGEEKGSC